MKYSLALLILCFGFSSCSSEPPETIDSFKANGLEPGMALNSVSSTPWALFSDEDLSKMTIAQQAENVVSSLEGSSVLNRLAQSSSKLAGTGEIMLLGIPVGRVDIPYRRSKSDNKTPIISEIGVTFQDKTYAHSIEEYLTGKFGIPTTKDNTRIEWKGNKRVILLEVGFPKLRLIVIEPSS